MFLEPLKAVGRFLEGLSPKHWKWPDLNFIRLHYIYMISMSLAASVILYAGAKGSMNYIDALFFGTGASTQSGLNTIDVNQLLLYQQLILYFWAHFCNPITINTFLVFVRLHWFEKRFQHIVKETNERRRSRTRSFGATFTRNRSQAQQEMDLQGLESGVGGREIKVLHQTTVPNGMTGPTAKSANAQREFTDKFAWDAHADSVSSTPPEGSNSSSQSGPSDEVVSDEKFDDNGTDTPSTPAETFMGLNPRLNRDVLFADEVETPVSGHAMMSPALERVPEDGKKPDKHIAFVERQQQNARSEAGTLRIPGPRDFDRGEMPKQVDDEEGQELARRQTRNTLGPVDSHEEQGRPTMEDTRDGLNTDLQPRRAITINEPEHPGHRARDFAADDNDDEDEEHTTPFRQTWSKAKSRLAHRRNTSRGPSNDPAMGKAQSTARSVSSFTTAKTSRAEADMPYLGWQATIGRNSQFLNLTDDEREKLGGIEYRALVTLRNILLWYFFGFHFLGFVVYFPWILETGRWRSVVTDDGVAPAWWGVFTPASMFNDLGFTLTPDSMVSFQTATLPLLFGSYLIIIGNTGFPCMLRFTIWILSKLSIRATPWWEELKFLLDHPRRCFTLLFPSKATWWLFWVLVLLNAVDLLLFIILDLNDQDILEIPLKYRFLDGWFQATSTRTAGFSCVNLANLPPAIQVSYLIMMYISVFPVAISIRRTNVYEEKSLGIWGGENDDPGPDGAGPEQSFVGQHLRRQLSFDLWYVFLGFFIICIVEGGRLANHEQYAFTMFSVLFEIVSAYGTVGLSLGYPTANTSFSGQFHVLSKLVIIAMMLRGRHRGLPYALDRAILLPGDNVHKQDDETAAQSVRRRNSTNDDIGWDSANNANTQDLDGRTLTLQRRALVMQRTATGARASGVGGAGLGSGREGSPEAFRRVARRPSEATAAARVPTNDTAATQSKRRHSRTRSMSLLVGGLSAGPTYSKPE
ncbi:hypothetical protein B0A50_03450 [Salinomyces thailandicus]|uniref:Potassium transport protein n=1 Tax=Salinomyces thailandicus TaxID=706561 RepID=A0A4U0U3D5_9PEZI|nr:hypothetical protein B0A50_03450 [Salinomyces thailandica]